jgi:membrane protein
MAAALAYYAAFSLPSILLIVLFLIGLVFGRAAVEGQLQRQIGSALGVRAAFMVQEMVRSAAEHANGGMIANILGTTGLLYAATNVFAELQSIMNRAWKVRPAESGLKRLALKRFSSFLLIVGVALLVLISLGAATAVTGLSGVVGISCPGWLMDALEIAFSWLLFMLLFGLLFKALPDAKIEWADVKIGAMVTSALFIMGKFLIAFYLSHSTVASPFGAAGALALLLLWAYYSAIIFLFGAELTHVWAQEHGRVIQPKRGATLVNKGDLPRRAIVAD